MVVLLEECSQVDDRSALPHLLFEVIDEGPYLVDKLFLALAESDLLVLNVVNFALILLDDLCVALSED